MDFLRRIAIKLRSAMHQIWGMILPIKANELSVFIPMAGIMFCFLANFSALRSLKDSLVVPELGAEVISFLKLWFVFPSSVGFTLLYMRLSNSFNIKQMYWIILTTFSIIFLIFGFILYPNIDLISSSEIMEIGLKYKYLKRITSIIAAWPLSLLYIIGDLWSAIMINLMFWQLANLITTEETAKRFYPSFGLIGNFGLITSGNLLVFLSTSGNNFVGEFLSVNLDPSNNFVQIICFFIISLNLISILLVSMVFKKVYVLEVGKKVNQLKVKTKLSIIESFKLIYHTKLLAYIASLVICYTVVITILEGPWKAQLAIVYKSPIEYLNFMGQFNIYLGLASIFFVMLANFILSRFSWLQAALFSPVIMGITGTMFFLCIIYADYFSYFTNPIVIATIVGAIQNIISKSSKYSIFDTSKEIVYVPLSIELKSKGKAAIEVIGSKLGKSLGSFIQFLIFLDAGTVYADIYEYLLLIFIMVVSIWIYNVYKLNQELKKLDVPDLIHNTSYQSSKTVS